jgi:hypothetical protein
MEPVIDLVLDPELGDSGLGILGYVAGAFSPEIELPGEAIISV